jgi:hypothetical protein
VVKIESRNHWILLCIFDWNQFCPTLGIFAWISPLLICWTVESCSNVPEMLIYVPFALDFSAPFFWFPGDWIADPVRRPLLRAATQRRDSAWRNAKSLGLRATGCVVFFAAKKRGAH